jgi:hypothetical protein
MVICAGVSLFLVRLSYFHKEDNVILKQHSIPYIVIVFGGLSSHIPETHALLPVGLQFTLLLTHHMTPVDIYFNRASV